MSSKGEQTKHRILDTARELFYLNGYNNTSIDDIIKASRTKKGNIYFHYRSKEALGYAVIDSYLKEEIRIVDEVFSGPGSPLERIYRLFETFRRHLADRNCRGGCPVGNFAIEMSDLHNGFRKKINRIFDAWLERLINLLEEAKRGGELPPTMDAKALGSFMIAVWEGGVMLAKARKNPAVMADCIKSLRGILEAKRGS